MGWLFEMHDVSNPPQKTAIKTKNLATISATDMASIKTVHLESEDLEDMNKTEIINNLKGRG